jgi:hypothetical protein
MFLDIKPRQPPVARSAATCAATLCTRRYIWAESGAFLIISAPKAALSGSRSRGEFSFGFLRNPFLEHPNIRLV